MHEARMPFLFEKPGCISRSLVKERFWTPPNPVWISKFGIVNSNVWDLKVRKYGFRKQHRSAGRSGMEPSTREFWKYWLLCGLWRISKFRNHPFRIGSPWCCPHSPLCCVLSMLLAIVSGKVCALPPQSGNPIVRAQQHTASPTDRRKPKISSFPSVWKDQFSKVLCPCLFSTLVKWPPHFKWPCALFWSSIQFFARIFSIADVQRTQRGCKTYFSPMQTFGSLGQMLQLHTIPRLDEGAQVVWVCWTEAWSNQVSDNLSSKAEARHAYGWLYGRTRDYQYL